MWHTDAGWAAWVAMSFGMVVFWGLLIWGVVYLGRGGLWERREVRALPEDVLRDRLARGELNVSEYRERLEALHPERNADPASVHGR